MGCDGGTRSAPIFTRAEKGLKMEHLLEVKNLSVTIDGFSGEVQAVRDVSFSLKKGEVLAIVGESGCGKSVTSQCLMRLNPEPPGFFEGGEILYKGKDVLKMNKKELRQFRGKEISYIFQDPMTSLDPTMKIGRQIAEPIMFHTKLYQKEALDNGFTINERCWHT